NLTVVGEDHQVSMSRSNEQVLDKIVVLRRRAEPTFAASSLTRIRRDRRSLYVAGFCDGDRDVLVFDQVLNSEFNISIDNDGTTLVAELLLHLDELVRDHLPEHALIRKNVLELGNVFDDLFVLFEDLLSLKRRQSAKLQVEDRLCLYISKSKTADHFL